MKYFTLLTTIGATKIAAATVAKTTVNLTHIAVGDGNGTVPMPSASKTALVKEVFRTSLNNLKVDSNNANWITTEGYIDSTKGNFWIREVGIFDVDGDLIAIGNYPETFKPVMADGVAKDLYIKVIIEVSSADTITLKIDPSITLSTREYVDTQDTKKRNILDSYNKTEVNNLSRGFKNLFINGGFSIWERGTIFNSIANNKYAADRWSIGRDSSSVVSVNEVSNSTFFGGLTKSKSRLKILGTSNNSNANKIFRLGYKMEVKDFIPLLGQTLTISFQTVVIDGFTNLDFTVWDSKTKVNHVFQTINVTNLNGRTVLTFTLPTLATTNFNDTNDYLYLYFQNNTPSSAFDWQVSDMQLEVGNVATLFENRPVGLELSLCKRYFQEFKFSDYIGTRNSFISKSFIVPFRTTPAMSTSGNFYTNSETGTIQVVAYFWMALFKNSSNSYVGGNFKYDAEFY